MKTAEIFNGKKLITVEENSIFRLDGVWNWDIGTIVTFQVKQGIEVKALVQMKDGLGTKFLVTEIVTLDDFAEMKVTAEEVEVEVIKDEEKVEEKKEEKPKVSKKITKRELIEFIAINDIDIDTKNKTKAEIIEILTEMGYM